MIVNPYTLRPVPPTIAVLTPEGVAVSEHGEQLDFERWPPGYRLWASYETVYGLVRDGVGEALCWNNEEIRWRHKRFEDDWRRRPSDANVVKVPFDHLGLDSVLMSFAAWRDWLAGYGASASGTSGAAAWSLLRATLERRLVTGAGARPPLRQTIGGRQELGPAGAGRFEGVLAHVDLPAAYAASLARLRYGGSWLEASDRSGRRLEQYGGDDYPVFVRAKVRVPLELHYGPLVRRPRRPSRGYLESRLAGSVYPRGVRLQGVWTWEELAAAEASGCRVERVLGGWIHRSGWYPFAPWWAAIERGRSIPGLAGTLAKVTGNALWGRFCMDVALGGKRTIRSKQGRQLVGRALETRGGPLPAHDLAETVSGRVRARLYALMAKAGDDLVAAHTDGAWIFGGRDLSDDAWRLKEHARVLEVLDPQVFRYWPQPAHHAEPWTVFAGVPAERADELFERAWQKAFPDAA